MQCAHRTMQNGAAIFRLKFNGGSITITGTHNAGPLHLRKCSASNSTNDVTADIVNKETNKLRVFWLVFFFS